MKSKILHSSFKILQELAQTAFLLLCHDCLLFCNGKLSWDCRTPDALLLESSHGQVASVCRALANTLFLLQRNELLLGGVSLTIKLPQIRPNAPLPRIPAHNEGSTRSAPWLLNSLPVHKGPKATAPRRESGAIEDHSPRICPQSVLLRGDMVGANGKLPTTQVSRQALVIGYMANCCQILFLLLLRCGS